MEISTRRLCVLVAVLYGILMSINLSAQPYHRYINPEDLGSEALYADSIMTSITLPKGVASVVNNPKFTIAAMELARVMNDLSNEVMQIYVCGSTSPDGLWGNNVKLSQARTDAAADFLAAALDIPEYMIHKKSLNEDWNRLYEMVAESDLEYKYLIMNIIRSKEWGERKRMLQDLDGGRAWKILEKDFFPQLRCVRIVAFCKWEPSRPYMSVPVNESIRSCNYSLSTSSVVQNTSPDTVYVRDTVYYIKETVVIPQEKTVTDSLITNEESVCQEYRQEDTDIVRGRKVYDTPWMMGFKTNLLSDAILIPIMGVEFQIADHLSLELQGWCAADNIFVPSDKNASFYGIAPELRWWIGDNIMRKGSFVGLHGQCAWYTFQWKDDLLYQNGPDNVWIGNFHDPGNSRPAWSAGITYGYSLGLGKKAHWGIEFVLGLGYARYSQNVATYRNDVWEFTEHQDKHHYGLTKIGVNLTYRFSLRKVRYDYYE